MSKLDQLLNRVPPGFEEAFAILMVINAELQGKFRRIVLDTTIFSVNQTMLFICFVSFTPN
uniref:Uncharacterized protein n=1 Tax=Arundo donax TaxID=35708 RepID=A0A0A9H5I0_ARUDO